ncbi:MAG: BamA/TamA family outer membrane protein [Holophagae bacterium]
MIAVTAAADDHADTQADGAAKLRLLPVPIFITEPAIGRGLGATLMLIHPRQSGRTPIVDLDVPDAGVDVSDGQRQPPNVTAVFGAYTDSDTWAAGAAHSASWRADRVRSLSVLMWTNINATVYLLDRPIGFTSRGAFVLQDMSFRIGSSRLFLGGRLKANRSETSFKLDLGGESPIEIGLGTTTDVGVALQAFFDSRDTTFTPSRGRLLKVDIWRHDATLGSDFDYWKTGLKALSFHPLTADLVLGLRAEGAIAGGEPPFWGYPWVTLRGVPAMRYQDERVVAVEAELRWNVGAKWAVVGFYGGGATDGDLAQYESQDLFGAGGLGARYLFAADLGLWIGADVARGPEDDVWYIQVGHAW